MPMMMEDHMDALGGALPNMDDDLFGDEVLPMAHRPPSKQLQQRVDELRSHGCNRTLSYSKQGIIASVSPDGTHVNLQNPRTNHSNGSWELGEPLQCAILPTPLPGAPIVHLAWAPTGHPELAVIDAFGRVCLMNLAIHANKAAYLSRKWDADAQDDLHSVVGCLWLPLQTNPRMFSMIWGPAIKENERYRFENSVYQGSSPCHPNAMKSSFVCVTAGGILKLFFSQNSNQVQDIHLEMESITSSDDLITHAAICTERGKLLIILATAAKQMKVLFAEINWGVAQPPHDKQIPGGSLPLRPSLKIEHVATTTWFQPGLADSHLDASMDQISHLELLPPSVDIKSKIATPAMILAVRVHIPTAESHFNMAGEYQSIIDSWTVVTDRPQQLHPAFEQRGSKAGAASTPSPLIVLHKRNPVVINKVILSIETSLHGKVICIGFSDGTVQYRDRSTLAEILPDEQYAHIIVPQQAGFHFAEEKPSLQTSFSPNLCALAQICESGKTIWNSLQYPAAHLGSSRQDPLYDAVLTALTMAAVNATHQITNHDDVLAVARPIVDRYPGFLREWVTNLVSMLSINVDYSEEAVPEHLVRNMPWLFTMSVINHFGFRGWFRPRSFNGKLTMLGISIRNIVVMMTLAHNSPPIGPTRERITPLDEPEVVNMLSGCAQWSVDLLSWIVDGLYALRDDPKFQEILQGTSSFPGMTNYLKEKNDVVLHLILSSTTRGFLTAICKRVTHLQMTSLRAQEHFCNASERSDKPPGPGGRALQRAYTKLQRATTSKLIKISEFEALLAAVGEGVRQTYHTSFAILQRNIQQQQQQQQQAQQSQLPAKPEQAVKKATAHCELLIFFGEQPPVGFHPFIKKFFDTDLANIMGATNRFDLFFADFSVLEVEDDPQRLAARKADAKFVDVFKRVEFSAPKLVKGDSSSSANGGAAGDVSKQQPGHGQLGMQQQQQQNGEAAGPAYRRCVRCCAVMEDVPSANLRPGYNFVMGQQRKCACGGNWVSVS